MSPITKPINSTQGFQWHELNRQLLFLTSNYLYIKYKTYWKQCKAVPLSSLAHGSNHLGFTFVITAAKLLFYLFQKKKIIVRRADNSKKDETHQVPNWFVKKTTINRKRLSHSKDFPSHKSCCAPDERTSKSTSEGRKPTLRKSVISLLT